MSYSRRRKLLAEARPYRSSLADGVPHLHADSPYLSALSSADRQNVLVALQVKRELGDAAFALWQSADGLKERRVRDRLRAFTQLLRVLVNRSGFGTRPPIAQLLRDVLLSADDVVAVLDAGDTHKVDSRVDALKYNGHALLSMIVFGLLGMPLSGPDVTRPVYAEATLRALTTLLRESFPRAQHPVNPNTYRRVKAKCPWGYRYDGKEGKCVRVGPTRKRVEIGARKLLQGKPLVKDKPPPGAPSRRATALSTAPGSR